MSATVRVFSRLRLNHFCSSKIPYQHRLKTSMAKKRDKHREIDRLGTWDSRLDFAINEESSLKHGTIIPNLTSGSVGVATSPGRRGYQEDRYTILCPSPNLLLLAVWDGHGGSECAEFCANQIGPHLSRQFEHFRKENGGDTKYHLPSILKQVVFDLNVSFERHWSAKGKKHKNNVTPGTTATIALIRDNYELVLAQVGDSRAILCRGGEARSLTKDHCPSRPEEKLRIESNGGTVSYDTIGRYMVNHRLSMSRSIGDFDLKPYGVIADPDIIRMNFKHGKDKYLVLTTDGINFVMSNDEIVELVSSCDNPTEAADRLIDQALLFASEDNVTVIVLPLGSWGKGDNEQTSMLYSIGRNMALTSRFS